MARDCNGAQSLVEELERRGIPTTTTRNYTPESGETRYTYHL
jgi:hypothetical protein